MKRIEFRLDSRYIIIYRNDKRYAYKKKKNSYTYPLDLIHVTCYIIPIESLLQTEMKRKKKKNNKNDMMC